MSIASPVINSRTQVRSPIPTRPSQALTRTRTTNCDATAIQTLSSPPNFMIAGQNVKNLIAQQKHLETQTVNQRNTKRYLHIERQLADIYEPPPQGFHGLFENLPVLRIRFNENTPSQKTEKWFYLGKVKESGKLGYGFVRVKDVKVERNGKIVPDRALEYKFSEVPIDDLRQLISSRKIDLDRETRYVTDSQRKRFAKGAIAEREFAKVDSEGIISPMLNLEGEPTLDQATEGFTGPDLSQLPYITIPSDNQSLIKIEPDTWHVIGRAFGKRTLIRKNRTNGILEIKKGDEAEELIKLGKMIYTPGAKPTLKNQGNNGVPIHSNGQNNGQSTPAPQAPTKKAGLFGWLRNVSSALFG